MRIFIQFSIIFTEVLLAGIELVGGALLLREYWRRRKQWHLFFMGASLLTVGVGNFLGYIGDFFNSHGSSSVGQTLTTAFAPSVLVSAVFYAFVFIHIYGGKWRKLLYSFVGIVALFSLLISRLETMPAFGHLLPVGTINGFFLSYGFWIVINVVTAVVAAVVYKRKKKAGTKTFQSDRLLMIGSLITILVAVYTALILSVMFTAGTAVIYLLLIIGIFFKYIGALSVKYEDMEVVKNPLRAISGSLTTKVVVACGVGYVVLTFALMSTVTQFYVGNTLDEQQQRIQGSMQRTAHNFRDNKRSLVDVAQIIALHGECDQALQGRTGEADKLLETLEKSSEVYDFYLVSTGGEIVHSSHDKSLVGKSRSDSPLVRSALDGQGQALATEYLSDSQVWAIVAANPIKDSSGKIQGAFVISSLIDQHDLPTCFNNGLSASGCGFISESGAMVYSSGQDIDVLTADRFRRSIRVGATGGGGYDDLYHQYFVESVDIPNGDGGFYYAFVTQEDVDREIARLLSVLMLVFGMFFLVFSFLLVFSMHLLLRPLLMLKVGAERLSKGDYDYRIRYKSADEIGQLAKSFNSMSDTISDRTIKLSEKVQEQRDFLSHTAHEIRTPLNIFRWSLEMLRFGDVGPMNNEQMELLENMNQTNDRIRRLVGDLLEVSRLQQGQIKLKRSPVDMNDLIDEVAGSFAVSMREKKLDFYWKYPETDLPQVSVDRDRILQVITNLLGNAVKFTNDEGLIEVRVERVNDTNQLSDNGNFLLISVEDNGRGIPKKEQEQIYRRFYRGTNAITNEIEGTGLGLFLSKQYIEMHGGQTWFESKEDVGSTFYFTIPINKD